MENVNKKQNNIKQFLSNTIWAIKLYTKISPGLSALLIIIKIVQYVEPILQSFLFAKIINQLAQILINKIDYMTGIQSLIPLLGLVFIVNLVLTGLSSINRYLTSNLSLKQDDEIEKQYLRKRIAIDIQQYDNPKVFDIAKKAEDNIWKLGGFYSDIVDYLAQVISGFTSVILILKFEPRIILLAIIFIAPAVVKDIFYNRARRRVYDSVNTDWRRYWEGRWLLTVKSAITELKIQNVTDKLSSLISDIRRGITIKYTAINNKYAKYDIATGLSQLYTISASVLVIRKVILTSGAIGDATFNFDLITRVNRFINVSIIEFFRLVDKTKYIQYIRNFFELEPELKNGTKTVSLTKPPKIELCNVSFKYPNSNRYALRNVSLVINPKDEIAIVGENGAGKSTLIKLLLRIYDPDEGEIKLNGTNIKQFNIKSYYDAIGALFQDYYYIGFLNMEENIEFYGTKNSKMGHISAAKLADIDKAIRKLPKKYEQICSNYFDDGVELSFGQSQKLVIARAFYRNSPVLILDEPTASIDAIAESKIFTRIYKFTQDKTVIIISHRFSTVRNAKKIYVLHEGKIVEQGSHKELLGLNGRYAKSFHLQAKGYSKED
jgi:ABC-type multidrug transport system fused ATPase/permease subunit